MNNRRYVFKSKIKASMDDWGWLPVPSTITVHEEVYEPYDTGLLDSDGDAIMAFPAEKKIGFIHWGDEYDG